MKGLVSDSIQEMISLEKTCYVYKSHYVKLYNVYFIQTHKNVHLLEINNKKTLATSKLTLFALQTTKAH